MSNKSRLQANNSSLEEIITQLNNLPDGLDTSDATATSGDILSGKTAYVKGTKVTGNIAFQPAQTITPGTTNQTIAAGKYLEGAITVQGDANLVADNIVNGKTIFGVTGTAVTGGGDTSIEDGLVAKTLTTYTNYGANIIGVCAFYSCKSLTNVSFLACTSISSSAFYGCSNLTSVNFPVCTAIGDSAFYSCKSLTNVSFPACKSIYASVFCYCQNLTSVNFPACTYIGGEAFGACQNLTNVNFPACTYMALSAFRSCTSLTNVSLPACKSMNQSVFYSCTGLVSIYLGASTVCFIAASNVFAGTGITSTTGSIFVPASLLASYKSATNWAYFADRIFALEDGNA